MTPLPRLTPLRRTGAEQFRLGGAAHGFDLLGFWQWSVSDLMSNATRGRLAEFLVAQALGIDTATTVRDEWAVCDLCTAEGVKIEVKSSAYLQSWHQTDHSKIVFSIRKARPWNADTNELAAEAARSGDLYVFALLHHRDKATVDPLDLDQWCFYVVPTVLLEREVGNQGTMTLASLERLAASTSFSGLATAVIAPLPEP